MNNLCYLDMALGNLPIPDDREGAFSRFLQGIDFEVVEFGHTIAVVNSVLHSYYTDKQPDIIFLDFIQLVEWKQTKDQRLALDDYMAGLKALAKQKNIGIVIVSQERRLPSGSNYEREPDIMDLKGSGILEQVADKVIFVYQYTPEPKYANESQPEPQYFIKIGKARQGRKINCRVKFLGEFYKFEDFTEDT